MISEKLAAAWAQAKQNYYYIHRWSVDSQKVADSLQYFWNHGQLDPERVPIPAEDHYAQQLYLMGQAYWEALPLEKHLTSPVLGPMTVAFGSYTVGKSSGWRAITLPVPDGTKVYASRGGKIPHINPDGSFPFDADGAIRYGYEGVTLLGEYNSLTRKPKRGEQIATVTGGKGLTFSCAGPEADLFRAVFGLGI